MELLVGYIEYEKTLTNFKGGLEKNHNSNEINDRQKELIYLTFPTHIFSSNFNIKKINESIRKGKSIEELIQYNETVWIALIGRDKSTRSFIGISILKAFVLEKLIHGPKSKEELISLSFLKWPNINKKGLEEKVSEVLDSLADEGIILVS